MEKFFKGEGPPRKVSEIPERASPRKKRGKLREVEQVPSSRMLIASKNTQTAGNSFSC
jgi:hypothetical protein